MTNPMKCVLVIFFMSGCAVLKDPYLYEETEEIIERIIEDESKKD